MRIYILAQCTKRKVVGWLSGVIRIFGDCSYFFLFAFYFRILILYTVDSTDFLQTIQTYQQNVRFI